MHTLSGIWNSIQRELFPWLEEELDPLTKKQRQFVEVMELLNPQPFLKEFSWCGNGRKPADRLKLFKAFVAKAIYNFPTTEVLVDSIKSTKNLRRLCGWEKSYQVPSLSTFSRAFEKFAEKRIPEAIHEAMLDRHYSAKVAGHVSRDSTAVRAREKPAKKAPKPLEEKRRPGRPNKGEVVAKKVRCLDLQPNRSLEENLAELPKVCDRSCKKNSKGHLSHWVGYKLHADVVDGDIPVSVAITSASVHDSQVAIPLAQMTAQRVTSLYDLMDAAYDADPIRLYSQSLGHVPLIDSNPRRGQKVQMEPHEKARYAQRSSAERVFSMLKDNYGGRNIRVRGPQKVLTHLMFGVLVITATQLFRLLL